MSDYEHILREELRETRAANETMRQQLDKAVALLKRVRRKTEEPKSIKPAIDEFLEQF